MADPQTVLEPNPYGSEYSTDGGGEQRGVWGGRGATALGTVWVDPNDPSKGTTTQWAPSARQLDVERYQNIGAAAAHRGAYQLDYNHANAASIYGYQARDQQNQAANAMAMAAQGMAPSRAELLGNSMIDQGLQAQMAGAASARGGSLGQAAAIRQASQNAAVYQQQGTQQLAGMRADEMANARGQWMQGLSGMRGQDLAASQNYAQQAQAQGQMELAQRQLNQQGQLGYEQLGWNTNQAAMNAGLGMAGMEQQNYWNGQNQKLAERQMDQQAVGTYLSTAGALGGAAMAYSGGSGGGGARPAAGGGGGGNSSQLMGGSTDPYRAEGGPVQGGQPYIVGERGPELIVPAQSGVVVPNDQMGDVVPLYEPPGKQLHQSFDGRAFFADEPTQDDGRPRIASSASAPNRVSLAHAAAKRMRAPAPAASRPLTPDELRAAANQMELAQAAEWRARMGAGPAVRSVPPIGQVALMGGRESPY